MTENEKPQQKRLRIGDVLVQSGVITEDDVTKALAYSRAHSMKLGQAVVAMKLASEGDICKALGQQLRMTVFDDLSKINIDSSTVQLLPEAMARTLHALAISRNTNPISGSDVITVALSDPLDYPARDKIMDRLNQYDVDFVISPEAEVVRCISMFYRNTEAIAKFADQLQTQVAKNPFEINTIETLGEEGGSDAAVVNLLRSVFEDAINSGASDIHIEPLEKSLVIRL